MGRVLKNRFSGESGPAALLQWDKKTGRLTEVPFNEAINEEGDDDENEFTDTREFD